jgi:hypothetical protein
LAKRTVREGSVFQKGRRKGQAWLSDAVAFGSFWQDIPCEGRQRIYINLGICHTRSAAQRKCFEYIERLGLNSHRRLAELTSNVTFRDQGELWLKSLANRKRNPVEQTTIDTRRYALDKWIYPTLGCMYLADVNNHALKALVEAMAQSLSPASIRDYSNIVKVP